MKEERSLAGAQQKAGGSRRDASIVKSFDRGLGILSAIVESQQPMRLQDIADRFGIDKASASRFMATLERRQLVFKDPETRRYSMGARFATWLSMEWPAQHLMRFIGPHIEALEEETGQSAHMAVRYRDEVVVGNCVSSNHLLAVRHQAGDAERLHCSAVGKAIIAFLPADERERLLDRLPLDRRTSRTITDRQALAAHLGEVRAQGVAFDLRENYEFVSCVAAPVFDGSGRVLCSVGVSAVSVVLDYDPELMPRLVTAVKGCARRISDELMQGASKEAGTDMSRDNTGKKVSTTG